MLHYFSQWMSQAMLSPNRKESCFKFSPMSVIVNILKLIWLNTLIEQNTQRLKVIFCMYLIKTVFEHTAQNINISSIRNIFPN